MSATNTIVEPVFEDLGRVGYGPALEVQRRVHAEVLGGRRPPTVLLLEHEPVITISKRQTALGHLLADPRMLERMGVEVCRTDRGGDITYHGPGQLVAYPILPLERLGLNLRGYVRLLERVVIDAVAEFGIEAGRDEGTVGVWVGGTRNSELGTRVSAPSAKLAAIGVRVRRWVSMHGLALNVATNLEHFKLIVPCGLARPVTSMQELLGDRCPPMPRVKAAVERAMRRGLGAEASRDDRGIG